MVAISCLINGVAQDKFAISLSESRCAIDSTGVFGENEMKAQQSIFISNPCKLVVCS